MTKFDSVVQEKPIFSDCAVNHPKIKLCTQSMYHKDEKNLEWKDVKRFYGESFQKVAMTKWTLFFSFFRKIKV